MTQPYDDSFSLGPLPGGDVLFQPPGAVGAESPLEPAPPATAPAPASSPSSPAPGSSGRS